MYCPKCGADNPDNSIQCVSCGEPFQVEKVDLNKYHNNNEKVDVNENTENVESPLIWSILLTIFGAFACCCFNPVSLVTAIIAIVFATEANDKVRKGDIEGAEKSARISKILNWISFGFIVLTLLVVGFIFEIGIIFRKK